MPVRSKSDAETLHGLARSLYFSNDTIDWFLAEANAAQLRSVVGMIEHELALSLAKANREHTLEAMMRDIARNDLVILDEFGYVPLDVESSRLLFQVVSLCYETRGMILTANIEFGKWGTILGDDKLAAATVDRIVHHGRLVEFGGNSHRMDAALMLGKAEV